MIIFDSIREGFISIRNTYQGDIGYYQNRYKLLNEFSYIPNRAGGTHIIARTTKAEIIKNSVG